MEIWQSELSRVEDSLYTMICESINSTATALEAIEGCFDSLNNTNGKLVRQIADINERIDKLERKLNEREIV